MRPFAFVLLILFAVLGLIVLAERGRAAPPDSVVRIPSHGGSGSVIATGDGWTLVLTAAHMFGPKDRSKPVVVNMPWPTPGAPAKVGVKVVAVAAMQTADLALLQLNYGPVPYVSPVGPLSATGPDCWSIGFDELKIPPQCRPARITGGRGGDTLTDARPWHGRSGGALLDKKTGYLIGVCSGYSGPSNHAEYSPGNHGIYVSLASIHRFLSQTGNLKTQQGPPQGCPCPPGNCPCPGGVCPHCLPFAPPPQPRLQLPGAPCPGGH